MRRLLLVLGAIVACAGAMPTALRGHGAGMPTQSRGHGTRVEDPFVFRDVGDAAGIFPHLAGIRGHGAAWGDVDGDGWPDLFVTTFHNSGSKPSIFLRNEKGKFRPDPQAGLNTSGIGSGALFVDLTNSGRLDLYVSH